MPLLPLSHAMARVLSTRRYSWTAKLPATYLQKRNMAGFILYVMKGMLTGSVGKTQSKTRQGLLSCNAITSFIINVLPRNTRVNEYTSSHQYHLSVLLALHVLLVHRVCMSHNISDCTGRGQPVNWGIVHYTHIPYLISTWAIDALWKGSHTAQ